ncbi:MAG: PilZ domain-containing protein [Polyangia bacterium]|jgi:uncharacterized protein (TIGR02266 family)|nr:PilZ domain-containing protein [Polyangia bacterium]
MSDRQQSKESTRILQAKYASGEAFLKDLRGDEDADEPRTFFYTTKIPLSLQEQVILEVLFPEMPSRTLLRGRVAALEESPQGALIRFADEESETVEFVIRVARGETDPGSPRGRRYYRIPLEIPVDWQIDGHRDVVISSTDDVSGGGVQIRTQNPPPVGTDVVLLLSLDEMGKEQLRIPGRVAWVRTDESFSGMGVRFTAESSEEKKRLRDLVRKFMERGAIDK